MIRSRRSPPNRSVHPGRLHRRRLCHPPGGAFLRAAYGSGRTHDTTQSRHCRRRDGPRGEEARGGDRARCCSTRTVAGSIPLGGSPKPARSGSTSWRWPGSTSRIFARSASFAVGTSDAVAALFEQVLRLCQSAGLVRLGHVAVDGTKIKANASRHKAMSYGRMKTAEPKLAAEVQAWLTAAEREDRAEDAEHGADLRGDEMPTLGRRQAAPPAAHPRGPRAARSRGGERCGCCRPGRARPLVRHA